MIWYPYAPLITPTGPLEVCSAKGVRLMLQDGRSLIDGTSSWWSAIHGYQHQDLDKAAHNQLHNMAHVMLGGLTHQGAIQLAQKLIEILPDGFGRVFFSDSGSVGVEVALKMAIQYWRNKRCFHKKTFLSLTGAYHGDTFGAMSVCDPEEGMHHFFDQALPCHSLKTPFDIPEEEAVQELKYTLAHRQDELAAVILEPILQAAGGFRIYGGTFLKEVARLCRQYDVLLIADEVATGFGRTGKLFACNHADISADIVVLGKALTAGYMGHAATVASKRVCKAFESPKISDALMHGPTFMGNPLACAIALKSIDIFLNEDYLCKIATIERLLHTHLQPLIENAHVKRVSVIGATGAIECVSEEDIKGFQEFAIQRGVFLRPFGRYIYTMPPYIISAQDLIQILSVMRDWFLHR